MSTLSFSAANGMKSKSYVLTYSVSSSSTATTVTLTSVSCESSTWTGADLTVFFYADSTSTLITSFADTLSPNQTKSINKTHSWNKTTSAQTKRLYVYVSAYVNGSYTNYGQASVEISVPALASYNVTYNANGGSGAPATQKKYYGVNLTLSVVKPTRSGFSFVKWFTKADGTGTGYNPGATYSSNAALNLYAKWSAIPSVTSLTVIRSDSSGNQDDSGTYASVTATWTMSSATSESATVTGTITPQGGTSSAITLSGTTTGTGGTVTALIPNMDTDTQYVVAITAANGSNTATRSAVLTRAFFIMDFKAGGGGIGIGRAAPSDSLAVGYNAEFDGNVDIFGPTNIDSTLDTTGKITASGAVQAKGNMVVGPSTTSNVVTFGSTNPKIEFQNTNASQNGQLIFTDYDAVHPGATLAWITNQTQSWFHTQHIHATGDIRANSTIHILSTDVDTSSATNGLSSSLFRTYGFLDKSNRFYGYIEGIANTDGSTTIQLMARNFGTGAKVDNGISMSVANDGTRSVSVSNAAAWRNAIGVTPTQLYYNATGVTGTVTLSQTAANFNYLRIFIRATNDNNQCSSVVVYAPNNKHASLEATYPATNGTWIKSRIVKISAKSITNVIVGNGQAGQGGSSFYNSDNTLYIYRVEGWK